MTRSESLPVMAFKTPREWAHWLARNHARARGVWLRFFKKGSGIAGIGYAQALDEALCHGWIDGQTKKADAKSWLQRYTPRRPKSVWSKRNTLHAERLIREGRMTPAGLKEIAAAKADGRWEKAYDSPRTMRVPADFMRTLSKDAKAKAFFLTLNKANVYAIAWRLQTAKRPETRERRMKTILAMLARGERFH